MMIYKYKCLSVKLFTYWRGGWHMHEGPAVGRKGQGASSEAWTAANTNTYAGAITDR